MKKFFLAIIPITMMLTFVSCNNETLEEVVGGITMTVGTEQVSMPAAIFTKQGDRVIITSSNLSRNVAIYADASATGTYTLGAAKTTAELITSLGGGLTDVISGNGNYLLYTPSTDISNNAKIVLVGSITFDTFETNKVSGSFTGTAVSKDAVTGMDVTTVLSLITGGNDVVPISGTFTAVGQ